MTDTDEATARRRRSAARPRRPGRQFLPGPRPAVMLQVHADDSFLRFIRAVGQPADSHTLPRGLVMAAGMDAALEVAARTGQPVIGPPMSEEEAAAAATG